MSNLPPQSPKSSTSVLSTETSNSQPTSHRVFESSSSHHDISGISLDEVEDIVDAHLESIKVASGLDPVSMKITLGNLSKFLTSSSFDQFVADEAHQEKGNLLRSEYAAAKESFDSKIQNMTIYTNLILKTLTAGPTYDKAALKRAVDESVLLDQSLLDHSLVEKAQSVLLQVAKREKVISDLVQSTSTKDIESLTASLTNARILGIPHTTPELVAAEKQFTQLSKRSTTSAPTSTFTSLSRIQEFSSVHVSLLSVLPLAQKTQREDFSSDIDVAFEGIAAMPNITELGDVYTQIPSIIYDCVQYLRYNQGWAEEGLFRLSDSSDNIQNVLSHFDSQHQLCEQEGGFSSTHWSNEARKLSAPFTEVQPTLVFDRIDSVHCAANVLKRFLRNLKDPIIPPEHYEEWLRVSVIPDSTQVTSALPKTKDFPQNIGDIYPQDKRVSTSESYIALALAAKHKCEYSIEIVERFQLSPKLTQLYRLLHSLPSYNFSILSYLIMFMYCIAQNPLNKMTASTLAIVLAPNVLRPHEVDISKMDTKLQIQFANNAKVANDVLYLLIAYAPVLISDVPPPPPPPA